MDAKTLEQLTSINEVVATIDKPTKDGKNWMIKEKASQYLGTNYPHQMTIHEEKKIRAKANKMKTSKKKACRAEAARITREIINKVNKK